LLILQHDRYTIYTNVKELHSRLYYKKLRKECEWVVHSKLDSSSRAVFLLKIEIPFSVSFIYFLTDKTFSFTVCHPPSSFKYTTTVKLHILKCFGYNTTNFKETENKASTCLSRK